MRADATGFVTAELLNIWSCDSPDVRQIRQTARSFEETFLTMRTLTLCVGFSVPSRLDLRARFCEYFFPCRDIRQNKSDTTLSRVLISCRASLPP